MLNYQNLANLRYHPSRIEINFQVCNRIERIKLFNFITDIYSNNEKGVRSPDMKISETQVKNVIRAYNEKKMKRNRDLITDNISSSTASLTSISVEIKRFHNRYKEIPNTREHLIDDIKNKIENGTYQISGYDIVEKLMGREAADLLIDEMNE